MLQIDLLIILFLGQEIIMFTDEKDKHNALILGHNFREKIMNFS